MEEYEALLYFMSGIFSYKILTHIFHLGKSYEIYNETVKNCIGLLKISEETRKLSQEVKYILLAEAGMPAREIESVRTQDKEVSRIWKTIAINALTALLPKHVKRGLMFKDWESAMNIIDKEMK